MYNRKNRDRCEARRAGRQDVSHSPEGLGINAEDDLSAVGAALNRVPLPHVSSLPQHAAANRNQLVLSRQQFLHDRSYAILLLRRELRNEGWNRSGMGDAGNFQCMMQNTPWSPGIPKVFKIQEPGTDTLRFRIVMFAASGEDRSAQRGGHAPRTRSKSG